MTDSRFTRHRLGPRAHAAGARHLCRFTGVTERCIRSSHSSFAENELCFEFKIPVPFYPCESVSICGCIKSFRISVALLFAVIFGSFSSSAWQLKIAPIMTDWAQLVDTNSPLPEHPRPQMVRTNWLNLNGIWQFQPGATNQPAPTNQTLSGDILVPFPMESALSGVAHYYAHSWYRRTFTVPPAWSGNRILLHLDGVDWESEVFINGQSVGVHKGGYDEATYDITAQLSGSGPQELIVRVYDPTDNAGIPRGKQTLSPGGIMYTSSSGIWQPVWLEPLPATSIVDLKLAPDIDAQNVRVTTTVSGPTNGVTVNAIARSGTNVVGIISGVPGAELVVAVPNPNLWSPTDPFLYDLEVQLTRSGTNVDSVTSYFGMRKISLGTTNGFVKMLLNNQFTFEFGPLDQGFWPDGIYTAPTDDALKSDIEQMKLFGYSMVRKHIKVERPRWYYWADKLGVLVWQDMPSVNSYTGNPQPILADQFRTELLRMVQTHWNHPAIISWVIFNEGQGQQDTPALVAGVKALDPSRLVNEASGGSYTDSGDILDAHSYPNPGCPVSASQAVVCGEFGGVGLGITNHTWAPGWGYVAATNGVDLAAKFEDFCFQLSDFVQNRGLSAAVYTELTDVETELNGFLTYDRKVRKPDANWIRASIASASSPIALTTIVPTSQTNAQSWRYTNAAPAANWYATNFNDSAWATGSAGFGAGNPPNTAGLIRTTWNTADIWLRRTFNPGSLSSQQISNLFFMVYNDEDVEVYINSTLAGSATGYRTSYGLTGMNAAGKAALLTNAINTLAVHCHQTGGGQYIDVGIVVRNSTNSVPAIPTPPTPSGLRGAAGPLGNSLGWNTSPGATNYTVKRALASGGPYTNLILQSPINAVTDSSATAGVTYYYVVSAQNASSQSGDSVEVSITTVVPLPATPVTWLKADALTGLTNGAPVANWPDSTGNGFAATQSNPSRRPIYVTNVINGLPVVRFDATALNYLAFSRPVQDDFTIYCVYRSTQGVGNGTSFWQGAGLVNGEVANTVNDFGLSLNANGRILAGTGNPDVTLVSTNGVSTNGLPHLATFKRTRNAGAISLYVDGLLHATGTGGQQSLTSPSQLVLGAQQTLLNFLTGDMAEVKIYDAALNDSDRMAEESALFCKYGIGPGAPPMAPAGFTASTDTQNVFLNWQPVVGASGYKLTWALNSSGPYTQVIGNLAVNHFVHTNAASGQTNYYRVAAYTACGTGSNSAPVSVVLARPRIEARLALDSLKVSWPNWAGGWSLFSASNLSPPVLWLPVTNAIVNSNGQMSVTLPVQWNTEFFRLSLNPGS